jgi:hypothetical protein
VSQKLTKEVVSSVWERPEARQTGRVNVLVANLLSLGGVFDAAVLANLDTTRVTDEGSTRTVLVVSGGLVVVAFALIGVTVWFWRNTVPDPDALESLTFFEERVVDGAEDDVVAARRREPRSEEGSGHRDGMHLPRRHRAGQVVEGDRTESAQRSPKNRRRRHRDDE